MLGDAPGGNPEVILIATGSEVGVAVAAHETLLASGIRSRVLSMPSWDTFGASAPLKALQQHFGFEPENVVAIAKELLGRK